MTKTAKTKDEQLLVSIYDHIDNEVNDETVCPYFVGKSIGQSEKTVKCILRQLTQANFLKKYSESEVGLTIKGRELVENYLR